MALTTVLLQEQWEQVQSAPFLDEVAESGRLEGPRAGLPGLPPEATPGEIVAALQQIVLRDLKQVQQAQENHSIPPHQGRGQVWGARLFRQLPAAVLVVGAAIIAGVALAGAGNKTLRPKTTSQVTRISLPSC